MKIIKLISFSALILLFTACNNNITFNEYKKIDEHIWNKDSSIIFTYNSADTINHYNVFIYLRHNSEYKFQNLWLFTLSTDPNGNIAKDTLECYLHNNIGEPLGQDYFYIYEMPLVYMQNIKFPSLGEYKFSINQAMRDSLLTGIESLGLTIEKVDYGKE